MSKNSNFYIEESPEILRILLDSIPEPSFIVDREGIIRIFNKAYEKFLGVTQSEAIGRHVKEIMPNTRIPQVLASGKPELGEIMGIKGVNAVVQRIPIITMGQIVGAVARVSFRDVSELKELVQKVTQLQQQLEQYKQELRDILSPQYRFDDIIGAGEAMARAKRIAGKIAQGASNVLILGESGVGKEMFAHALHASSTRYDHPFICLNCAAIPKELVETELFGHEHGAFTGARRLGKPGKFELADGGSLFLDEIGDMPLEVQPKILRVLECQEVERIGATKPRQVDVRIIIATNRDLEKMVADGLFRADLYFRLNIATIRVPPLREHGEDIPLLVDHLVQKIHRTRNLELKSVRKEVVDVFQAYHWPGNVRELSNLLEHLMNVVDGPNISLADLPRHFENRRYRTNAALNAALATTEREFVTQALNRTKGNKRQAAKILGIHRSTLYDKLRKYGLSGKP